MGFLELPDELIAEVFTYLNDVDVFAARSASKALDKGSFAHFGRRFFRKKGFMITTQSLEVLQNIAHHEGLQNYVQHLWFNPDCYTFARPECAPDDEDDDLDEADELITPMEKRSESAVQANNVLSKQYDAYRDCMRDHRGLLYTNQLEIALASAFRHLGNLKTVGMRRSEDYGPYGWTLLRDAIGEDPRVLGPIPTGPSLELQSPTQLFIAIIRAISKTDVKLRRLYTDAVEIDNIRDDLLLQSQLNGACNSIWYLELNAIRGWLSKHPEPSQQNYNTLKESSQYGSGLARLLKSMPGLKEIGLQIFPDRKQSHLVPPSARNPESWAESYPYLTFLKLATDTSHPNLTRIKLEKITTTSKALQAFLGPCGSHLSSLKLRDIRLLSSYSSGQEGEEGPRPWQTVFTFLSKHCAELDYILLYHLLYDRGGVSFTPHPPSDLPDHTQDYLINHVPASHGGQAIFTKYEHITLEVDGKEEVSRRLEEVVERHWYHRPLFSYAMDDELWHTDTSDEEW